MQTDAAGNHIRFRRWGLSWAALTASLALHVWDEAAHDFLSVYNRNVEALRTSWPLVPLPTFTFGAWLGGLSIAIAVSALLTAMAFRGHRWLKIVAYPYGVIMLLNGLQHIIVSLYLGKPMPGVLSSPLLVGASIALLAATRRVAMEARGSAVAEA
jgi:hypothetical protein